MQGAESPHPNPLPGGQGAGNALGRPALQQHRVVDIGTIGSIALIDNAQITPVPEPGTLTLMGLPLLAALALFRRRAARA